MANGDYSRLMAWNKVQGRTIKAEHPDHGAGPMWTITVGITSPVSFTAYGVGKAIDDAAAEVIAQLQSVEGWQEPK